MLLLKIFRFLSVKLSILRYRLNIRALLSRIFNKSNISKVVIIFSVGLVSRFLVDSYFNINVFIDYLNSISILYYFSMSIFRVFINELASYYDLNIIPSFILHFFNSLIELVESVKGLYRIRWKMFNLKGSNLFTLKDAFTSFLKDNKLYLVALIIFLVIFYVGI